MKIKGVIWKTGNGYVVSVPSALITSDVLKLKKNYSWELIDDPVNAVSGMSSRDLSFMTCAAVA